MADTVLVSNSAASSNPDYRVWTDELVDPVSGLTVQKQIVGLVDATAGGTTRAAVGANGLAVSATIIGTVPISLATLPVTNAGTFAVQNTSIIPGTGATNLGKAEDAVAASGDTGVMALAVRNDAGTALAASGDYIPLMVNASGALYVTGGGGGTQYVEDTASAGGETMTLAGVVRQDTLGSSTTTDGDYAYLKVNAAGALYTETTGTIAFSGTMPVAGDVASAAADSGNPVKIGGKFLTTQPTVTNAQRVDAAMTARGAQIVAPGVDGFAVTIAANSAVNVAQINGVTPLMGAGNTGTGSPRVTIATDQVSIPVANTAAAAGTATLANVSGATSSTTLLAANAARLGFVIINDSTSILYVKFGSTASATSYTYQLPGTVGGVPYTLESTSFPRYTGIITGIWVAATGAARTTELTA